MDLLKYVVISKRFVNILSVHSLHIEYETIASLSRIAGTNIGAKIRG